MASKKILISMSSKKIRPSPLDDPPTASSSSDDEQPEDEIVEEQEEVSSEDDDEGSSSEEEEEQPQPPSLASKPQKDQPPAESTPVAARSSTKRPIEDKATDNGSKRSKKKKTEEGESSKKSQRVFTPEDELNILKALPEFISRFGKDPMKDPDAFHSFLKNSLQANVNIRQLKRKLRGFRDKFGSGTRTKTSDDFSKAHDKTAFELFNKAWGNSGANEAEENGKTPKSTKKDTPIRNNGSAKKDTPIRNNGSAKKDTEKVETDVDKSLSLSEMYSFVDAVGFPVLNKDVMKRGMELMTESKRDELDERWRKIQITEMEVFATRLGLIKDQTRMAMEAYKKSINLCSLTQ